MKPTEEIESRIRYLLCEELSRRVLEAETRLPHLCAHNHRQPLDTRKTVEDLPNDAYNRTSDPERRGLPVVQTIGLCMLGAEDITSWPGNICEDPIDAQRCPYFNPTTNKTVIFERFKENMGDVGWVQQNMPEAYALLWVLETVGVALPWWKRLWFRLVRIHVAPMVTPDTVLQLMPPSPPEA